MQAPANFEEKVEWMLMGGAIGDALGVPVEMKTQEYIQNTFGRVTEFLPSRHNIFFGKKGFLWEKSEESGYYSDDTVLTFAVLRSLAKMKEMDHDDLVEEQIKAFKSWPYGFGRATREVFQKISKGSDPFTSGMDTAGNGIMMKQAALAAQAVISDISEEDIAFFTHITHNSPEAVVASLVHHKLLVELLLQEGKLDGYKLLVELRDYANLLEKREDLNQIKDLVSEKLNRILSLTDPSSGRVVVTDSEILDTFPWGERIGASGYVLTTLWIVYSLFFRKPDFEWFIDTVNIWGDTDTYASIIGNMIGALRWKFYPEQYPEGVKDYDKLRSDIKAFLEQI